MTKFIFAASYEQTLARIEDHIFETTKSISSVESFLEAHDAALIFVSKNPSTSPIHSAIGNQSWNFADGRYRMFFKVVGSKRNLKIYLLHLIDNKEDNPEVYRYKKIPTYSEE